MTEQEWLTSTDPQAMLAYVRSVGGPFATDRKIRLFACGCCRLAWDRLTDGRSRQAVEVAERCADGLAAGKEVTQAQNSIDEVHGWPDSVRGSDGERRAWLAARVCLMSTDVIARAIYLPETAARQATLLRCVFGKPFQSRVCWNWNTGGECHDVNSLSWNDSAVPRMARHIYDAHDWGALPVLADALEEAGCPRDVSCHWCLGEGYQRRDAVELSGTYRSCPDCHGTGRVPNPLLAHLREGGPHCRGCYVLDLLLGKK